MTLADCGATMLDSDALRVSWRPAAGGHVSLTDAQLAKIGLMIVYDAAAKASAAAALRATKSLTVEQWIKLEKHQFIQINVQLVEAVKGVDDELSARVKLLEEARFYAQEKRNIAVHSVWGQAGVGDSSVAYDYRRQLLSGTETLDIALQACAELKRAANWMAYRVAELIEHGVYSERVEGSQGMSIRTSNRLVRL